MLSILTNGLGEQKNALDALPPLADARVEKIARILCIQHAYDPDKKEPGRCCIGRIIGDNNAWKVGNLSNGDPYVFTWMRYIEDAQQILKAIDT